MTHHAGEPLLAGALADFALADVMQLLELGARSGVLVIDGGPVGSGRVVVRRGRVVSVAAADGRNALDVPAAVAALLELPSGRWSFHAGEPAGVPEAAGVPDGHAGTSIGALLVEAARRRDERALAPAGAPGPGDDDDEVPRLALALALEGGDGADGVACLTAVHLRVLAAVDGARDLRAIAASLRCEVARVREAVAALRACGLIEPADASACLA